MRTPSRQMPGCILAASTAESIHDGEATAQMPAYAPADAWPAPLRYGLLAMMLAAFVGMVIAKPAILVFIAAFSVLIVVVSFFGKDNAPHFEALKKQRQGESICTFARAADCRHNDSWIVRAVYEETKACLPRDYVDTPLRWEDHFVADLKLEWEDVEDIAEAVAQRAGYSLEDCSANPLNGKVSTLGELVLFMAQQPRCPGAAR